MTLHEVMEKLQQLSPEDQQKVVHLVQSLAAPERPSTPRLDPRGMFAHRGVHLAAEDLEDARRETWANCPRDFPEGATP